MRIPTFSALCLCLFLLTPGVFSQYHESVLPGIEGSELQFSIVNEYKPDSVLSYSGARNVMFSEIYNINDTVTCVYSGHKRYLPPGTANPIAFLLDNNSTVGINTEHTFPQSQGAGAGNPRADLYHLFPARVRVNEARGSFPFSEIIDTQTDSWYYLTQQLNNIPGDMIERYSEKKVGFFEPREDHKGNVARSIFYFFTMYEDVANASFFESQKEDLCAWHLLDPVDSLEWSRNDMIASYQANKKNPFILDCTVAERLYCPDTPDCLLPSSTFDHALRSKIAVFPNPASGELNMKLDDPSLQIREASLWDLMGREIRAEYQPEIHSIHLPASIIPGIYSLRVIIDNGSGIQPVTISVAILQP